MAARVVAFLAEVVVAAYSALEPLAADGGHCATVRGVMWVRVPCAWGVRMGRAHGACAWGVHTWGMRMAGVRERAYARVYVGGVSVRKAAAEGGGGGVNGQAALLLAALPPGLAPAALLARTAAGAAGARNVGSPGHLMLDE